MCVTGERACYIGNGNNSHAGRENSQEDDQLCCLNGVTCGAQNCNATSNEISVNSEVRGSDAVDCNALLAAAARQAARD